MTPARSTCASIALAAGWIAGSSAGFGGSVTVDIWVPNTSIYVDLTADQVACGVSPTSPPEARLDIGRPAVVEVDPDLDGVLSWVLLWPVQLADALGAFDGLASTYGTILFDWIAPVIESMLIDEFPDEYILLDRHACIRR